MSSLLTTLALAESTDSVVSIEKYSPDEARDFHGRWTSTGGSKESRASAHAYATSETANTNHTAAAHFEAFIAHNKAAQAHLNKAATYKNNPANAKIHLKLAQTHLATATSHEQAGLSVLKPKTDWGQVFNTAMSHIGTAAATVGGVVGAITAVHSLHDRYTRRAARRAAAMGGKP